MDPVETRTRGNEVMVVVEGDDWDRCGVTATSLTPTLWRLWVNPTEYVRTEPLQSDLQDGISNALANVSGVESVQSEDRETWIVVGGAEGAPLVRAAYDVVVSLRSRIDAALDAL